MLHEETEKVAISLGWMKCERNGVDVWYSPEGGHVFPDELSSHLDAHIDALLAEPHEPMTDDIIALMRLGNPFLDTSKN